MPTDRFYDDRPREQSLVKIAIVEKYFTAWSRILAKRGPVCYADLYAGAGSYQDGTPSVPVRVVEMAIKREDLRARLLVFLNDRDRQTAETLAQNLARIAGLQALSYAPVVRNLEVGEDDDSLLAAMPKCPTLTFLDPFGYKGLSLSLLCRLTEGFGCECVLFFNMNRISAAVSNPVVEDLMADLFGQQDWPTVRQRVQALRGTERERAVLEEFGRVVKKHGIGYMQSFRFVDDSGSRTSHYVVHLATHHLGHDIMKDIMAREGGKGPDGFPTFTYDPTRADQPPLPLFDGPSALAERLASQLSGRNRMTFSEVCAACPGPFVAENYREALRVLEDAGRIYVHPTAGKRPAGTFGPTVRITFPPREDG